MNLSFMSEHWTPISSTLIYKPRCHSGTDAAMSVVTVCKSSMYHLLPKCHAYMEGSIQCLASQCLLLCFFNFLGLEIASIIVINFFLNKNIYSATVSGINLV